jgi:hypothetical protein
MARDVDYPERALAVQDCEVDGRVEARKGLVEEFRAMPVEAGQSLRVHDGCRDDVHNSACSVGRRLANRGESAFPASFRSGCASEAPSPIEKA